MTFPGDAARDPVAAWRTYAESADEGLLEALLDDEAIFESPVVHTPQRGKQVTSAYLRAAVSLLGVPSFRYLNEWRAAQSAVLEFVCEIEGVAINGVDIIEWNADGRICRFKVMVRPLKAINLLHQLMAGRLAAAKGEP